MGFADRFDGRHIFNPLFWQRHDSHEALLDEMRKMHDNGIYDFILEARPHPDYLGEGWWSDLDFITEQAEKLDMAVWIFDDGAYPSGKANGVIAEKYPELTKRYLIENHMDATGPMPDAHFLINEWLGKGESVYRVIAAKRTDRRETLDADSLTDITDRIAHGRLYWSVPEGEWRIFVIKLSPNGQEQHTNDYVNPISFEAVKKYIEVVHQAHYDRYKDLFGKRIAGFFTDEPRFGNIVGYNRIIGKSRMPLPWSAEMERAFAEHILEIPLLWYDSADKTHSDVRYVYMDGVSRLLAECFTGQIGDWCRAHNVKYIGHVVEENGAHSRLGYGAGHYFRAMKGLDAAGIDIVNNMFPEQTDGVYSTMFNEYDCDFNHWGLAKMASSAAHADPKKAGRTLCEAFGAYGWFEGLKLMKWITDRLVLEGVNIITPHAFSPSAFPDEDCPPHFYARGNNPQFRLFHVWSDYARRLIAPVEGAAHIAPVAVLYHAEAEWGGECEPFEKAVKALMRRQIDCDVVCIDDITADSCRIENAELTLGTEKFKALVVPYAEVLPGALIDKLEGFIKAGLTVVFTNALPERKYFGGAFDLSGALVCDTEKLPEVLDGFADIKCAKADKDLQYIHFRKDALDIYLMSNQSTKHAVDTSVTFRDAGSALIYDPMKDRMFVPAQSGSTVRVKLEPWETLAVVFGFGTDAKKMEYDIKTEELFAWKDGWKISVSEYDKYPAFTETAFTETGDLSVPGKLPDFSGTVRYEREFTIDGESDLLIDLGRAYEAVTVTVNGTCIAELICPPYRVKAGKDILKNGKNTITVEVINTLVKAHHDNPFDRFFPQEPTGICESVKVYTVE